MGDDLYASTVIRKGTTQPQPKTQSCRVCEAEKVIKEEQERPPEERCHDSALIARLTVNQHKHSCK